MNEAPKKIWYSFEYEKRIIAGANEEDTPYIRADLVDGLVKGLEGMMEVNKELTFSLFMRGVSVGDSRVDQARAALKALEEE